MAVADALRSWLQSLMLALGAGVCHQLPQRSFISGGLQQPVCARCSGIYVATIFGLAALWWLYRRQSLRQSTLQVGSGDIPLPAQLHWSYWVFLVVALVAMAYDGFTSYLQIRPTTDMIRLITGLAVGAALAPLLLALLGETLLSPRAGGKILARPRDWALYLGVLTLAGLVDYPLGQFLGLTVPVLVTVCLVATYAVIVLVVLGLFKRFERRVGRLRDATIPALIAVAIALILLMFFALFKTALLAWFL
ncbi:MAG: DUF2085 domain-containing protein [Actinomycetia bacterium]|nr:DUF2085 domain-containing protein [Actinomycetes bacterium]